MKTVVVDANNLMWQSYYALPKLSIGSKRTEIAFGFLLRILSISKELKSSRFIFCFDTPRKYCKRREVYSGYKQRDSDISPIEKREVVRQMDVLRKDILPSLGFKNIFRMKGYEADDLIACLVVAPTYDIPRLIRGLVVIVSSDTDLHQLLQYDISIYKPREKKVLTIQEYWKKQEEQGLRQMGPQYFAAEVKAIAGCSTDTVEGVEGIGEKRAWQYLQEDKFKEKIESEENQKIIKRNRKLVHLPFGVNHDNGWPRYYKHVKLRREILFKKDFIKTFSSYWFKYFLQENRMEGWRRCMNLR